MRHEIICNPEKLTMKYERKDCKGPDFSQMFVMSFIRFSTYRLRTIAKTRKSVDGSGEPSHIPALIKANRIEASYLFPVTRKSIFLKNLKTSIKSPPGGAGEYNLHCAHP